MRARSPVSKKRSPSSLPYPIHPIFPTCQQGAHHRGRTTPFSCFNNCAESDVESGSQSVITLVGCRSPPHATSASPPFSPQRPTERPRIKPAWHITIPRPIMPERHGNGAFLGGKRLQKKISLLKSKRRGRGGVNRPSVLSLPSPYSTLSRPTNNTGGEQGNSTQTRLELRNGVGGI